MSEISVPVNDPVHDSAMEQAREAGRAVLEEMKPAIMARLQEDANNLHNAIAFDMRIERDNIINELPDRDDVYTPADLREIVDNAIIATLNVVEANLPAASENKNLMALYFKEINS